MAVESIDLIKEFFALYGPLGLGWVVAYIQWRQGHKQFDSIAEQLEKVAKSLILLVERTAPDRVNDQLRG